MRISRRQWLIAIGCATLLHVLLVALLIWSPSAPPPSPNTSRGVTVSLDQLDTSPRSIKNMPIEQLQDNSHEAGHTTSTPASAAPASDSVAAADAPIDAAEPVTPTIGNAPSGQPEAIAAAESSPPDAAAAEAPQIAAAPAAPAADAGPSDAAGPPSIAPALSVTPQQTLSDTTPAQQVTAHDATQPAGASRQGAYGNREQATDDYIAELRAWLGRHKHYPDEARKNHTEGTVKLFLAVDADGKVLESRIASSSGSPTLDAAARRMLAASRPLPPMPAAAQRNRLELIIPIVFKLHE
ncbi:energy transducer TonB [Salinisphaera hydrothermalis]|uniref:TonB family protein n=1 Tax=Salinisphaera hydrothermalis (strain C41B8) TaxID=1304275 RepID=A0A084INT7_SALHC|nr:energy transducer TonB [Salinisphaera hydrothermalis]KEZ78371.1 TonB family protein [Salinisphaera hydrothermalis C41B8]